VVVARVEVLAANVSWVTPLPEAVGSYTYRFALSFDGSAGVFCGPQ